MGSSCSSLLKRGGGVTEPEGNETLSNGAAAVVQPERTVIIKATEDFGPPSLTHCAILSLARNMDSLDSLRGVPQELVQQLFAALVTTRLLTHEQLPLLVSVIDARLPSYALHNSQNPLKYLHIMLWHSMTGAPHRYPGISDEWLAYMGTHFTGLTRLDLSHCINCTDEGSKYLSHLRLLKTLKVDHCLRLGDASLQVRKA